MDRLAFEVHDGGLVLVNPAYRDLLAGAGLLTFEGVMGFSGGERLRRRAERENLRLVLRDGTGRERVFYLKRHRPPPLGRQFCRLVTARPPVSPARREWEAVADLSIAGFPTPERVAMGERRRGPFVGGSFYITAELTGFLPADLLLRETSPESRWPLLESIADLVRRFHAAGFHHRDLYLCHIFARPTAGGFELTFIDLQRVGRFRRRRWVVKDIAQLAYSARGVIQRAEWERWLCRYLGVERLEGGAGRFAAAVQRKAERIAHHDRRLLERR